MTLLEIFSKEYLFDTNPPAESKLYIPLGIVFSLMIIFAVLFKILGKKSKIQSLGNIFLRPFITGGILGFVYLFARYERLAWLGSRFFLVLILIGSFGWAVVSLILTALSLPKVIKEMTTEEKYQKYLPKKKL